MLPFTPSSIIIDPELDPLFVLRTKFCAPAVVIVLSLLPFPTTILPVPFVDNKIFWFTPFLIVIEPELALLD